ncbi:hypothetical protein FOCC_FOCC014116 [Frankliniella occidentalis]|nr:hypothetical protein FOCC_FOCC014116 [Frankliniella occidentalis]
MTRGKNTIVTLSDEQLDSLAEKVTSKIDAKLEAREKFVDEKLYDLQTETELLRDKTDDLEQRNRLENLRIFGIKEADNEDTDELVIGVARKMGLIHLEKFHISRSHRVGKKTDNNKPRAIIVKFVSFASRQKMFQAKKSLKGTGISVKEDLTRVRQAILLKASDSSEDVWSQNGIIVIKEGKKFHRIQTMRKLEELLDQSNK